MKESIIEKVDRFNRELLGIKVDSVKKMDSKMEEWLIGAIQEELEEFKNSKDLVGKIDAMIDLIYYALGSFTKMGLKPNETEYMFNLVHEKNMQKIKGRRGRRNVDLDTDAIKPEGWIGPENEIKKYINKINISRNINNNIKKDKDISK